MHDIFFKNVKIRGNENALVFAQLQPNFVREIIVIIRINRAQKLRSESSFDCARDPQCCITKIPMIPVFGSSSYHKMWQKVTDLARFCHFTPLLPFCLFQNNNVQRSQMVLAGSKSTPILKYTFF